MRAGLPTTRLVSMTLLNFLNRPLGVEALAGMTTTYSRLKALLQHFSTKPSIRRLFRYAYGYSTQAAPTRPALDLSSPDFLRRYAKVSGQNVEQDGTLSYDRQFCAIPSPLAPRQLLRDDATAWALEALQRLATPEAVTRYGVGADRGHGRAAGPRLKPSG